MQNIHVEKETKLAHLFIHSKDINTAEEALQKMRSTGEGRLSSKKSMSSILEDFRWNCILLPSLRHIEVI